MGNGRVDDIHLSINSIIIEKVDYIELYKESIQMLAIEWFQKTLSKTTTKVDPTNRKRKKATKYGL
jgi:hypothetical protein